MNKSLLIFLRFLLVSKLCYFGHYRLCVPVPAHVLIWTLFEKINVNE